MSIFLDLRFDSLTQLFTEHGVKLTRERTTEHFPNCCPYAALAVINGSTYMNFYREIDYKDDYQLSSIEAGFEGWDNDGDVEPGHYEVGQRLYEWSQQKETA